MRPWWHSRTLECQCNALDSHATRLYLTETLINWSVNYGDVGLSQQDPRCPRRSDAPSDLGPAGPGRGHGQRAGGAVRHDLAGGVASPKGARDSWAHLTRARCTMAAL